MSDTMDFARAALASQRRSSFLRLSPATSDSYPRMPTAATSSSPSFSAANRPRRASSSASASGFKILKLGPVYGGEHIDENQEDFHFDDVPSSSSSAAASSQKPASLPGGFLSLAPAISPAPKQQQHDYSRRSSSASTTTSTSASASASASSPVVVATGFRVLKLGPVHGGEHADEHKGDFYDVPHSPLGEHMT